MAELKIVKDYIQMKGKLYHRMPGGILSRCVGHEEAQRKLEKVHNRTYGFYKEVSLYQRLQRMGFYWPNMSKGADLIQTQCETCHLAVDKEESHAVFATEDWKSSFMGYLAKEILPQKHGERCKLRKLVTLFSTRRNPL